MTMNHNEALSVAREAVRERMASMSQFLKLEELYDEQDTIMLRTYLDARGLAMVPKEATDGMIEAGEEEKQERQSFGMTSYASDIFGAMLAAAPYPFGGE